MSRLLRVVVSLVISVGVVAPVTTGASAATSVQVSGKIIGGSGVLASDAELSLTNVDAYNVCRTLTE